MSQTSGLLGQEFRRTLKPWGPIQNILFSVSKTGFKVARLAIDCLHRVMSMTMWEIVQMRFDPFFAIIYSASEGRRMQHVFLPSIVKWDKSYKPGHRWVERSFRRWYSSVLLSVLSRRYEEISRRIVLFIRLFLDDSRLEDESSILIHEDRWWRWERFRLRKSAIRRLKRTRSPRVFSITKLATVRFVEI